MPEYILEIADDDFAAEASNLYGCSSCMGDLGDWDSSSKSFWADAKKKGIAGTDLRAIMVAFISMANSASDTVRYPFMYEIESRAELQTDAKVPGWLLDQVQSRLQSIVANTGQPGEAESVLNYAIKAWKKGTIGGKAPAAADVTKKATAAAKEQSPAVVGKATMEPKKPFPWLLAGGIAAGVAGVGLLVWAFWPVSSKPAPAVAGPRYGRRRRRGRR